ncbi:MAG: NusG domain II-containing protein [Oscillospiraceae bacterium]
MKKFLNINTLLIGVVLCLGLGGIWYMNINKTVGAKAVVQIEEPKSKLEIDLSKNKTYTIDARLPVTLEVVDGGIAFIHSHCPDKLCEGYGYIRHEGEMSACLPAGVIITIDEAQ